MPVTLRKRPQCHYCGKRLNTAHRSGSKIHCDHCSADNYFDVDNNIIDVPTTDVNPQSHQSSLPEVESESSIFCKTCLTNQAFYVRALADYLPDEDDPRYQELEDALPTYKKELDLRYPRCCAQCEPRVQAQISQANYDAKTDHLRRMMHQNQGRRRRLVTIHKRSLLISAAGLGYAASLFVQLVWHALASQAQHDLIIDGMSPAQCLRQWPVPIQCTNYIASLVPPALILGLLCVWWNPYWQQRLRGTEGRLVGLRRFYILQTTALILRFTSWVYLADTSSSEDVPSAILHVMNLVIVLALSMISNFGTIRLDTTPLVDWSQVRRPMVDPNQFRPPARTSPPPSQPPSQISLDAFARPSSHNLESWRPPTPPETQDSMDWTPSSQDFNPRPRLPKPKFEQPSPFHGALPAAPTRGSLNPNRPPPPPEKKALGIAPGFFGLSKSREQADVNVAQPANPSFAPAKFFAHERDADTGLENIFDKMFSVRDPLEDPKSNKPSPSQRSQLSEKHHGRTARRHTRQPSGISAQPQATFRLVISCAFVVVLAVMASSLVTLEFLYGDTTAAPSTILPYSAIIGITHAVEEYAYQGMITSLRITISSLQLLVAVASRHSLPADGAASVPVWNKLVIGWLFMLMLFEVYHFCQLQSSPISPTVTAQMVQSMERAEQSSPHELFEVSATSHPSPEQSQPFSPVAQTMHDHFQPQHTTPTQARYQQPSAFGDFSTLRKRDSDESISSVSSIQTTSTASGWKTPKGDSRTFDWQNSNGGTSSTRRPSTNISRGLGGLSLSNDFGTGTGVAGPRTRQQGNLYGRYR